MSAVVSAQGTYHFKYYASDSLSTEAVHDAGFVNIDKSPPVTAQTGTETPGTRLQSR